MYYVKLNIASPVSYCVGADGNQTHELTKTALWPFEEDAQAAARDFEVRTNTGCIVLECTMVPSGFRYALVPA